MVYIFLVDRSPGIVSVVYQAKIKEHIAFFYWRVDNQKSVSGWNAGEMNSSILLTKKPKV
jgi:hypothetical protein